jgi:hypothetical protein
MPPCNRLSRAVGLLFAKLALNCTKKQLRWPMMGHFEKLLSARILLPAILVALAQGVLVPSRARASCGDYVLVGGQTIAHSGAEPAAMNARGPRLDQVASVPAGPCPCSGPQCSQNPPRPVGVPVAPVTSVTTSDWGMLDVAAPPVLSNSRFAAFEQDPQTPPVALSAIYRPPRQAPGCCRSRRVSLT